MSGHGSGLFDRYVELREIGSGGMARVVLAHDRVLERNVALKLLRTNDPEFMQRLLSEARITARCQHDNVVDIYEVGQENGCPYIVLEYLRGKPLSALLETSCRLPYRRALELLAPVLQALQHVHELGVVHRDLKPDNIFVLESGASKLLDFGIAKLLPQVSLEGGPQPSPVVTRAGMIVGTYEYMSPEQWSGVGVDHLTDIWASGMLLYTMICGCHPLHPLVGHQLLITGMLDWPMPSMLEDAPADVPQGLIAVVDRCLRKAKAQRWQSARDLLGALSPFLATRPPERRVIRHNAAVTLIEADAGPLPLPPAGRPREGQRPAYLEYLESRAGDVQWRPERVPSAGRPVAVAPPAAVPPADARPETKKISLLFLAADPAGTNQPALERQAHDIQDELARSGWRDSFELITQWAPESLDLLRALRKRPTMVHFAGTSKEATDRRWGQALLGDKMNGLYLRGQDGRPRLVAPTALDQTFGSAGKSVRVVIMSSCYSGLQAEALLRHVDCVVGMPAGHPDAAKAYAIGFYGALGERESVATAHDQGCAAVALEGHDSKEIQLKIRAGVNASKLILPAAAPPQR